MLQSILDPRSQRFALDKIWRSLNPTRYLLGAIFILESMRAHTHFDKNRQKIEWQRNIPVFSTYWKWGVQIVGSTKRACWKFPRATRGFKEATLWKRHETAEFRAFFWSHFFVLKNAAVSSPPANVPGKLPCPTNGISYWRDRPATRVLWRMENKIREVERWRNFPEISAWSLVVRLLFPYTYIPY